VRSRDSTNLPDPERFHNNKEALFVPIIDIFSNNMILLDSINKLSKKLVIISQNCEIALYKFIEVLKC
jgi:hypothetical protein